MSSATTARDQLLSYVGSENAFDIPFAELRPLQLTAATETLQEARGAIRVLERRARDAGIDEVKTSQDLVPLLFAHTTYKSYPEQFLARGEWKKLELWLSTLSAVPFEGLDSSGVTNVDEWIECLWDAGHCVYATSGTTGKFSFLDMSRDDVTNMQEAMGSLYGWPNLLHLDRNIRMYQLGPSRGPNRQIHSAQYYASRFAKPGEAIFMTDEPLRLSQVRDAILMRRAMVDGTAKPEEVAAFERAAAERAERMAKALEAQAEDLFAHRDEPVLVVGMWAQHWSLVQLARAAGIPDGSFHPDSVVSGAGGNKGNVLPPDYKEQILAFYGDVRHGNMGYGMTELTAAAQLCEASRYHAPPWLVVVPLDKSGEQALEETGVVEGRFAFLDLMLRGRWGGLISGDKVIVDYADTCACGRPGPVIHPDISRYTDVGDDKITCAGTFDAYVRGMVE